MLKKFMGNRKISTKNLYLGELKTYHSRWAGYGTEQVWVESFDVPKIVIVKEVQKEKYSRRVCYEDIFTKTRYLLYGDYHASNNSVVITNLQPAWTNNQYIKYSDAQLLFEDINKAYIKK